MIVFARIRILLIVLFVLAVGGYFVFSKIAAYKLPWQKNNLALTSPRPSISPTSLNTPLPGAPVLRECEQTSPNASQNSNEQKDCYWGSSEFLSPAYKNQK